MCSLISTKAEDKVITQPDKKDFGMKSISAIPEDSTASAYQSFICHSYPVMNQGVEKSDNYFED